MKASKLIVFVGGVLGIIAFFLPMVAVDRENFHGTASAFQVVKGLDVGAVKTFMMIVFAPALVLSLIGGLGVARKRFGRGAGALSLIVGLVGLGIAALLKSAAEGDAGVGLTLLLVTGIAGVVGGVLALARPERFALAAAA